MNPILEKIRERAREIVSRFPLPDFYIDHHESHLSSRRFFNSNTVIFQLRKRIERILDNDFGHGLIHAEKVTVDAGALVIIESILSGASSEKRQHYLLQVQIAGLLHDLKRKENNHAEKGATYARQLLNEFSLKKQDIDDICLAIQNHEAFKPVNINGTDEALLISNCLYDADKFRWGADNFTDTIWDMLNYLNKSPSSLLDDFPHGLDGLAKIRHTFRSDTGKKYGPQFIEFGLIMGVEIYELIKNEFSNLDSTS